MSHLRLVEGVLTRYPTVGSPETLSMGGSKTKARILTRPADARSRRWKAMTIERLVVAFRAGEYRDEVFYEIHRRYHRPICRFFRRKGFSAEDCRDLAQETFLRLWRGMAKFREESKFGVWLYTVAGNVVRSEISRRTAGKRGGESVSFDDYAASTSSDDSLILSQGSSESLDKLLAKEEAVVLRQQIKELPPRMLRILLLRLDQDLKLREIAAHERVTVNTVKSQLGQAKDRLRRCLAAYLGKTVASSSEEALS